MHSNDAKREATNAQVGELGGWTATGRTVAGLYGVQQSCQQVAQSLGVWKF